MPKSRWSSGSSGSGASGRNGGWVEGLELKLPGFLERFVAEAARWVLESSLDSLEDMRRTVSEGALDCDLDLPGGLVVATCAAHAAWWGELLEAAARVGREDLFTIISRDEAVACSGVPHVYGGLRIRHAGSVQPALLAQGLRRLAREAGVRIFEASPMTKLVSIRTGGRRDDRRRGDRRPGRAGLGTAVGTLPELRRCSSSSPRTSSPRRRRRTPWMNWAGRRRAVLGRRHDGPLRPANGDDRLAFGRGGGRLGFAGRVIPEHFHDRARRSRRSSPTCTR